MKPSNLVNVLTVQTHDLITRNLHYQLMGAGNDIDLKYEDNDTTFGPGRFQPECASITLPRASDYRRASCQGERFMNAWSQLKSAWCVSVAEFLAKESCQIYTYLELLQVFQYFPSLSYSAWHKPDCL